MIFNYDVSDLKDAITSEVATRETYVRPNLLQNWCFTDPLNFAGQTAYYTTGYAIDYWRSWANSGATPWLKIVDGGMQLSQNAFQYMDRYVVQNLIGKYVTHSILFADGNLVSSSRHISSAGEWYDISVNYGGIGYIGIHIDSDYLTTGDGYFVIQPSNYETLSSTVTAIKMEIGQTQSLAHYDGTKWVLNSLPDYNPVFAAKVDLSTTIDNIEIAAGDIVDIDTETNYTSYLLSPKGGYRPLAITGFTLTNATNNGSNSTNCNVFTFRMNDNGGMYIRIKNNASSVAKIRLRVYVLWIKSISKNL